MTQNPPTGDRFMRGYLKGCMVLIVAAVLLIGGCTAWVALSPKDASRQAETSASLACRNAVRDRLKAPSTAQFSDDATASESGSGFTVTVTGTVDAENSFGAKLRNTYRCTVRTDLDGEASTVKVESLG